jgi:hypothetical protein
MTLSLPQLIALYSFLSGTPRSRLVVQIRCPTFSVRRLLFAVQQTIFGAGLVVHDSSNVTGAVLLYFTFYRTDDVIWVTVTKGAGSWGSARAGPEFSSELFSSRCVTQPHWRVGGHRRRPRPSKIRTNPAFLLLAFASALARDEVRFCPLAGRDGQTKGRPDQDSPTVKRHVRGG